MDRSTNQIPVQQGITRPHGHDVLYGRGKHISINPGNLFFMELVKAIRVDYVAAPKEKKSMFAQLVVQTIRNLDPPGRFLQRRITSSADNLLYDVGDKNATNKARQALREGAPDIKKNLFEGTVRARNVSVETLIAEEAARLYEERFGSTTAGDVADLSPLSESVMQTLLKRFSRNEEVDDGGGGVRQETTPRRSIFMPTTSSVDESSRSLGSAFQDCSLTTRTKIRKQGRRDLSSPKKPKR